MKGITGESCQWNRNSIHFLSFNESKILNFHVLHQNFNKLIYFYFSELKKLSEESLARPPEEVFDIICKLGEGSYGSVYKALHKESGVVCKTKYSKHLGNIITNNYVSGGCH